MRKLITIFSIPELRTKIFFTLMLLAIYRLGFWIPLPFVDQEGYARWFQSKFENWQQALTQVSMFSGTTLSQSTIFGLGIMPYISASIIFQLLCSIVPSLEKLQKEGEVGRKKINEYTRYATVLVCILQSWFVVSQVFAAVPADRGFQVIPDEYRTFTCAVVSVLVMTAGTMFLMWIGEQIDEYGIGNGISLIIMAGIIGRLPQTVQTLAGNFNWQISGDGGKFGVIQIAVLLAIFLVVIVGVILITQAQRRIPTQSAKHVRGRRVFGGNRQFLPLRLNQSGVMPIIFASSLLIIPTVLFTYLAGMFQSSWLEILKDSFNGNGFLYTLSYIGLIYFFCYFWTAITFNPKDIANNLKDYGNFIPGYRPGKRTADYLERVLMRITYVGAAFLAVIAIIPNVISSELEIDPVVASFYGGTGLLIVISVALDLVQKINSHLVMRNYAGLTDD